MPDIQFNKTRIAPTPSGFLHLGNALSFLITASLAKKTGAQLLLRIDDMDKQRVNEAYLQDIFDTLAFLQINWDEGPRNVSDIKTQWSQLHRLGIYHGMLEELKQKNAVYACQCSRTQIINCKCDKLELPLDIPNVSWRLRTKNEKPIHIKTLENGIIKTTLPEDMNDFIVRKKDGYPAYQLTSVADDIHFGVDLVVRGEDLWRSTIAQHYLADVLESEGFKNITFHYHGLIMGGGEKKLSKSAGDTSIKYLREQGGTLSDVLKNTSIDEYLV
ncbi:MAG: glutamate--tRNA ligase family protein [Mucilaginibacter sp.]